MTTLLQFTGERRHEKCRYGIFSAEAYTIGPDGVERPFAMPLCAYQPPEKSPPAISRSWGGAIEFDRDCAVCKAYHPL